MGIAQTHNAQLALPLLSHFSIYQFPPLIAIIQSAMNMLLERYADFIIRRALRLQDGDVLSINTEEENADLASLIARKAKEITGNGSYIQNIENGKVTETVEAASDFPIEKKPTVLLYLPVYKEYDEIEKGKLYTAPEIQRFRMLSEPIDNGDPVIPFAAAPVPSARWGKAISDEEDEALAYSLLTELLSLDEDDYLRENDDEDILLYECDELNKKKLVRAHIQDEEGTDLEFSFLPGSEFRTTVSRLKDGRKFNPTIFSSDIFRAIDKSSCEGYFTITRPFMLFGRAIRSLSCRVSKGRITEFSADEKSGELMELYLMQDQNAGAVSELSIAEESTKAADIDYFALPEWDRMRGISITIGGQRSDSLRTEDARKNANDSLVTLTLPIGSDTTVITAYDEEGNEYTIAEDGFITEDY